MHTKHSPVTRDRGQGNQCHRFSTRRTVNRYRSHVTTVDPLSCEQLSSFFQRLRGFSGPRATYLAIRLALYTFLHISELRHGEWKEVKLGDALWDIRADRSKSKCRHLVPLSDQAIWVLSELREITGGDENMFPDLHFEVTFMQAMRQLDIPFGGSVFRVTASKHLIEMGVGKRLLEIQMGHAEADRLRPFDCAADMRERREMMHQWANWLVALEAEAVGSD